MKILLIEDDANIVASLVPILKSAAYTTDSASDGERGYWLAATNKYDLIILDYNLPKMDGPEIIARLRGEGQSTPILMLTVRDETSEKVSALNLGADDYMAKPFAASELLARMKAILRRPKNWQGRILRVGRIELDPDKFLVSKDEKRIRLSNKEFALLRYLMENKGRVLTRQDIMENIWDENADPFSNTIEVHIMNLRKKLEDEGEKIIFTVSNRGYKADETK